MEISDSISIMKALADSSRLLIVNSLMEKPQYVEELAQRLNLAVSTVSFHLKKLESANLVFKRKEQYYVVYHLNDRIFYTTLKDITSFKNEHKIVQDERIAAYKAKVLKTFFSKGKLIKLPSQHKKKIIVLEEILKLFNNEKVYPEKEIDSVIENVFDDYCTIRRLLIDNKLMFRSNGKYKLNHDYEITNTGNEIVFINNKSAKRKTGNDKMENRKEIIKKYKMTHTPMGVYKISAANSNKFYVGSSLNLPGIYNRHKFELGTGIHSIKELQESWNIKGEQGIIFEIIDKLEPKEDPAYNYSDDIKTLEDLWMDKLQKTGNNYFRLHGTMIKKPK
ncbi:MAG: DUF2087 domain-containing protein [Ignavibacteriales bacterium]|nr:MAG: DUF2087 domain-containing protein [Ignavibacteriales bacterium]